MSDTKKFRAKFQLQAIEFQGGPIDSHHTQRTLTFRAAWDPSIPENERFNRATPWAELKMMVSNPEVQPEIGQYFYVDFTPAT